MPDTNVKNYEVIDNSGLLKFAEEILKGVNNRITERIVQTVDAESDENHVASAKAVYAAISAVKTTKMVPYTGDINDIAEPDKSGIYLQRDDEADTTWMMYVYASVPTTVVDPETSDESVVEENKWISIGTTDINLEGYYQKDNEADLAALKAALGLDTVDVAAMNTSVEELKTAVDGKIDESQMVKYEEADIADIVAAAFKNTEILNPVTNPEPEAPVEGGDENQENQEENN